LPATGNSPPPRRATKEALLDEDALALLQDLPSVQKKEHCVRPGDIAEGDLSALQIEVVHPRSVHEGDLVLQQVRGIADLDVAQAVLVACLAVGRVPLETRQAEYEQYVTEGRDFEQWKRKPFLALIMYLQLQEQFGWEVYKEVFSEYSSLTENERPKTDAEKRDQWMIRFSRATGYNLGPFFEAWNIPVSQEAREQIKQLPTWIPDYMKTLNTNTITDSPI